MEKRLFDIVLSLILLTVMTVPMVIIAVAIKLTSYGPVLHWSDRVGKNNTIFSMPKFRTMRQDTPQVATHLLTDPDAFVTQLGELLRRYSLDEMPQIFSIIKGDMSFVGPRPALYNQHDLIQLRTDLGIHTLTPGLTGWAQINGRDELAISLKVEFDRYYLHNHSLVLDILILQRTIPMVLERRGIHH